MSMPPDKKPVVLPPLKLERGAIDFLAQVLAAPAMTEDRVEKEYAGQVIEDHLTILDTKPRFVDRRSPTYAEEDAYKAWAMIEESLTLTKSQFDICKKAVEFSIGSLPAGRAYRRLVRAFALIPE